MYLECRYRYIYTHISIYPYIFLEPTRGSAKPLQPRPVDCQKPQTLNPKPKALNPKPETVNPKPQALTLNPKPRNPKPQTQNPQTPKPQTQSSKPLNPKTPKRPNPKPSTLGTLPWSASPFSGPFATAGNPPCPPGCCATEARGVYPDPLKDPKNGTL